MNRLINLLLFVLLRGLCSTVHGQVIFQNPSFEGSPQMGNPPPYWTNCGEPSTPDTQPGFFAVTTSPKHGNTYLGLVCRTSGFYESVYQELLQPILPGSCFSFSIHLARSTQYANYHTPAILRIWGGNEACDRQELLWSSPLIDHTDWKAYPVTMKPKQRCTTIIIETYYAQQTTTNGNILIDHITDEKISILPLSIAQLGADTILCAGEKLHLSLPPLPGVSYRWQDSSSANSYSVKLPGTYWVRVQKDCAVVTDTIRVDFNDCDNFYIPNVFTPNGDGANEVFEIRGILPDRWRLEVFNRYGKQVYLSTGYENNWDGGTLPSDVYFYYLRHNHLSRAYKGWIQLLR